MRKLAVVVLVLAAGGALALGATQIPGRIARHALGRMMHCSRLSLVAPGPAAAAERMKWTPVAGESATTETHRRRAVVAPESPGSPPSAEPPTTPDQVVRSGDVMRVGSDIHVEKDEVVRGSVSAIGGDVIVDGHVEGDVTAMRGDVYLGPTARVDGDVVSVGGQLHEEPGAYVRGQRVTALPGSRLRRLHGLRLHENENVEHDFGGSTAAMIWLLVLLGIGWAISQLAPGRTREAVATLRQSPLSAFGIGGLVLALIIPSVIALSLLVAFLCITIIGIPLAIAALLGYGLFFIAFGFWGFAVGAGAVGGTVIERRAAAVAASPGVVASTAPVGAGGIVRAVVVGVLVTAGALVLGTLLGMPGMVAPFRVLGGFIFVIAIIVMGLMTLLGGGAWLRSEFATGMLGRWWQKRKAAPRVPPRGAGPGTAGAATGTPPPTPGAAPGPPAPPDHAPRGAPSPPSAFEPPAPPAPPPSFEPPSSGA